MTTMDLSGDWSYKLDYDDIGVAKEYFKEIFLPGGYRLPGSACENGYGRKQEYFDSLTKEAVRAPRERYEYIGPLWLQREVDVPASFGGKYVRLFLERVNIASELWVDGVKIGRQIIELSVPHVYNLTGLLPPGRHTLTLRVDNRNLLNIGTMASGYSIDTQGYWIGIIGRLELQCEEIFHIEDIQIYPGHKSAGIRVVAASDVYSPFERRGADFSLYAASPDGRRLPEKHFSRTIYNSKQVEYFSYEFDDAEYWDEFNPAIYTLHVIYSCGGVSDEKTAAFGMRTIEAREKKILLNGRQISLRGTIDCAIYPLTGYPPMDIGTWRKNFNIVKSYGMNHVRFHAWCPPEAAFRAADELGIYLSVEMPLWLNRDVCPLEAGEDIAHRAYFMNEAVAISKAYGSHPSFIMFSNGNENMGDFDLLEDITACMKSRDPRRLYTLTTNFDHPILPCEDYLCAYDAAGHKVRLQDIQDSAAESTDFDYGDAVRDVPVPVVSFEIGQYCVYPDVDIVEKYTGNMLPVNFDAIKKEMARKNVYRRLGDYVKASGDLAARLYKEEIEAALRTRDLGGFELLSLCDYTGQSTATVGILDAFYDSKGFITPQDFRRFCGCVVPLFRARRIYKNTESIIAGLDLYDFGETKIKDPVFELKIYDGGRVYYQERTAENKVSVPLSEVEKPTAMRVELSVGDYSNSWNIYVFIDNGRAALRTVGTPVELYEIIARGGRAVATAGCVAEPIAGGYIPVFWSPVHFPSRRPCGAVIDEKHPVFAHFPTGKYPDYQWKGLLDRSMAMDISSFGDGFKPIVEMVPNFVDNTPASPLFTAKVGKAEILYCGFDLENCDAATGQLRYSVARYMESDRFVCDNVLSEAVFSKLLLK